MTSAAAPLTTAPGAEAGRIFNFSAGPAVLPLPVLQQVQAELLNYRGAGMSVMEMSHRSPAFEGIIQGAEADLRVLLGIPDGYEILFLQGGATLQFAMLPMNLRPPGASADYILTGA
jgi:phosphoserine aminotransferase